MYSALSEFNRSTSRALEQLADDSHSLQGDDYMRTAAVKKLRRAAGGDGCCKRSCGYLDKVTS